MLILQMFREQIMDPWSLWEAMDVANTGPVPAETVPERIVAARKIGLMEGPTPEMVQMQQQLQTMQLQLQLMQMQAMAAGMGGAPPEGGPPPEIPGKGPGRPPSGQEPPQLIQKGGSPVVSESGR